jgi:CHAT domain
MFSEYLDCTIEIQPRNGDVYPFSIRIQGGDARGNLRLPTGDPTYQALVGKLADLNTDEEVLTELGQLLFAALFQDKVKEVLVRTQGSLRANQGLRLVLSIAPSEQEVGALPWEFLYDPDQGPLAILDMSIVRYLQQSALVPQLKTELPLRMLLTSAQPIELQKIKVEQELEEIEAALAELVAQRRIELTIEPKLTRSKLQRFLRQNFHIWHFAGHGSTRDSKAGTLAFEDANGSLDQASATELGFLLNRSSVRLIVLDACESGQLATEPFRNMAPALMRGQVPAVIAMQFKVTDGTARAFAGEFYRALAEGFPLDAGVTEGRKAVMGAVGLGQPDWGIPVVYTRAPDGKLFDLPPAQAPAPVQPQPQPVLPSADSAVSQADKRATEMAAIQNQIKMKRRVLNERKLQEAKMGINTDPMIKIDIEDLERDIAKLQRQLQQMGGA